MDVQSKQSNRYSCYLCTDEVCLEEKYTCNNAYRCYTTRVVDSSGRLSYYKGCVNEAQVIFICKKQNITGRKFGYLVDCCEGDLCNNGSYTTSLPSFFDNTNKYEPESNMNILILYVCLSIISLILLVLLTILFSMLFKCKKPKRKESIKGKSKFIFSPLSPLADKSDLSTATASSAAYDDNIAVQAAGDSTLREIFEHSITSGSGSGLPLLMQRTIAKEVQLKECIGKGRYGEVWRARFQEHVDVAVKIFFSRDENSWRRETNIYNTFMLAHDNILKFISSDVTSVNSCTQLWLITHYHHLGSLYDYLCLTKVNEKQILSILISAIAGINHLHAYISAKQLRTSLAHRDIKSKNILMKNNFQTCIADFGLALTEFEYISLKNNNTLTSELNLKVGTKRYMAPEILDESIDLDNFYSFKMADIYSFSLVIWEVCRCYDGFTEEYRMPYFDVVPSDPSFEDMKKVVAIDQQRPQINEQLITSNETLKKILELTKLCWSSKTRARPNAFRIKKWLSSIAAKVNTDNQLIKNYYA